MIVTLGYKIDLATRACSNIWRFEAFFNLKVLSKGERERESASMDCRRDTETLLDHEAQSYCTVMWFISEMYELQCRLDPLLTDERLTHMNGSSAELNPHRQVRVTFVSCTKCLYCHCAAFL